MDIGSRIKYRRELMGMSQEDLARKVGYKSRSSINKIESDGRGLPQSKIVAFANALDTSPSFLMGWEDFDKTKKTELNGIATRFMNGARKENLTLSEIAEKSGVPLNIVEGVANGTLDLPVEDMGLLAHAVNMSLFVLLGWETEESLDERRQEGEELDGFLSSLITMALHLNDEGKHKLLNYAEDLEKLYPNEEFEFVKL